MEDDKDHIQLNKSHVEYLGNRHISQDGESDIEENEEALEI